MDNDIPTDLERYKDVYDYLVSTSSVFEYISGNFVFDIINWLCGHYVTSDPQFVAFIWPCISVICLLLAVKNVMYQYIEHKHDEYAIFILSALLMIPIAILYELLKQVTAYSIIVYALSLPSDYHNRKFFFCIVAFFVHFASVLLLFPLLLSRCKVFKKTNFIYAILVISFLLSQINILKALNSFPIFNMLSLADKINAYSDFSDFGGSKRFYIGVIIYLILVLFYLRDKKKTEYYPFFLFFIVLLLNFANNHNLARLINTMFPFLIIFFIITSRVLKKGWSKTLYMGTFVAMFLMFNVTQYVSNIHNKYYYTFYDNNVVKLLTSNCIDLILYDGE